MIQGMFGYMCLVVLRVAFVFSSDYKMNLVDRSTQVVVKWSL